MATDPAAPPNTTGQPSQPSQWPAAAVAVTLIAAVGAIAVSAVERYETADEALKIWSALGTILGVITGAIGAYFFNRAEVKEAQSRATQAERTSDWRETQRRTADQAADALLRRIESTTRAEAMADPSVAAWQRTR